MLQPFINECHSDEKYIFWPDLSRAYYSKQMQDWLNGKVLYETKHLKPPNSYKRDQLKTFKVVWTKKLNEGV